MESTRTVYVTQTEGFGKGVWFEDENFGVGGMEKALTYARKMNKLLNRNIRVVERTISERVLTSN